MYRLIFLVLLILIPVGVLPVAAQTAGELTPGVTVEGSLSAGQPQTWTFRAIASELLSFRVESRTALDPVLTISDSDGRVVLFNDDYAYPESVDSLIEALTMPRTDTYTATVSAYGSGVGAYTLTMTRGFAQPQADEAIAPASGWEAVPFGGAQAEVESGENQIALSVSGVRASAMAYHPDTAAFADYFASVRIVDVDNTANAWAAGLALASDAENYYAVWVNQTGSWRFTVRNGDQETVLRDWNTHPVIRPGETTFTLSALSRNGGFDIYYNYGFVGSVSSNPLTDPVRIGVFAAATNSLESATTAQFADLLVTTPYTVDGEVVLPDRIVVGDAQTVASALVRRHLASADGSIVLTVPESSVQYARPGVNRLMLGGGVRYATFVLGAYVTINQGTTGVGGCGLVFRFASETDYWLAFLDSAGGAGLSQRSGEDFAPGIFSEGAPPERASEHHLLVIATQHTLYFYVDGRLIGSAEAEAVSGQIGAAVVNFEGVDTSCSLRNLWVWNWS